MATIKWAAGFPSPVTVLSTQLNALANNARTNSGTEVANHTNLNQFGKLVLTVTFALAPSAGAYVNIYMVTAPDLTNYEDGSNSADPGQHTLIAAIPVKAVTTAQILASPLFLLVPAKTKFILENKTGQAFPASGSIVELYMANEAVS